MRFWKRKPAEMPRELNYPLDLDTKTWDATISGQGYKKFQKRQRNPELLKKYGTIYEQGGMVSEALDSYPLYVLSNGWSIRTENETLGSDVENWLNSWGFEESVHRMVVDAIVYEYAFQEVIPTRGGKPWGLKPCPSWTFEIEKDEYGRVVKYVQYKDGGLLSRSQVLQPDEMVVFNWLWLLHRAYDDVMRDAKCIDGISESILRHGFPKYHIKVGQPGEKPGTTALTTISSQFQKLRPNMEFATPRDVDIINVDAGGVPNAMMYNNITVQRVCSALGVPEEILGLGRGSTEATANVRLQAFYDKISALQKALSRAYQPIIDKYVGREGVAVLHFNDVSPVDELMKIQYIEKAAKLNAIDPEFLLSRTEMRDYLGLETDNEDAEEPDAKPLEVLD